MLLSEWSVCRTNFEILNCSLVTTEDLHYKTDATIRWNFNEFDVNRDLVCTKITREMGQKKTVSTDSVTKLFV
jgi:hypothetical protein